MAQKYYKQATFWSCFRLCKTNVLHQLKYKGDIVYFLIEVLRSKVKVVQRYKESFQKSHKKTQVNTIMELSVQVGDFEIHLGEVLVHKGNE